MTLLEEATVEIAAFWTNCIVIGAAQQWQALDREVRLHAENVPIRVALDYFLFLKLISDRLKDATDAAVLAGDEIIEFGGVAAPA